MDLFMDPSALQTLENVQAGGWSMASWGLSTQDRDDNGRTRNGVGNSTIGL